MGLVINVPDNSLLPPYAFCCKNVYPKSRANLDGSLQLGLCVDD